MNDKWILFLYNAQIYAIFILTDFAVNATWKKLIIQEWEGVQRTKYACCKLFIKIKGLNKYYKKRNDECIMEEK